MEISASEAWNHKSSEPVPGRIPGASEPSGSGIRRCEKPSTWSIKFYGFGDLGTIDSDLALG